MRNKNYIIKSIDWLLVEKKSLSRLRKGRKQRSKGITRGLRESLLRINSVEVHEIDEQHNYNKKKDLI
jgi:hypothetical protein